CCRRDRHPSTGGPAKAGDRGASPRPSSRWRAGAVRGLAAGAGRQPPRLRRPEGRPPGRRIAPESAGRTPPPPPTPPPAPPHAPRAPALVRNWAGQQDRTGAPSDSPGAIGPPRYIELVTSRAAIYNRTSNTPTASGPLLSLTGCATPACTDSVFDVQVTWE